MSIKSMRVRSYRSIAADEHVPEEAAERYRTLKSYDRLRHGGCSEKAVLEQLGISRAHAVPAPVRRVRQRAWKTRDVKAVLDVGPQVPVYGQGARPGHASRKGREMGVSTVGRIIERSLEAGVIRPVLLQRASASGRVEPRRRHRFAKWARRWKYGAKARWPGELVNALQRAWTT